jgi:hypothetical protein
VDAKILSVAKGKAMVTRKGRRLLTPQECAVLLGWSADRVRDAIRRGALEGYVKRAGKGRRFGVERAVAELFAARTRDE